MAGVDIDRRPRGRGGRSPATSSRSRRWCRRSRSDGKRLHELAREGIEVEREARPVTVHRFDGGARPIEPNVLPRSRSSARRAPTSASLAADLGRALGGGAHLRDLRRTAIGSFTVDEAVPLDGLDPERSCRRPTRSATCARVAVDDASGGRRRGRQGAGARPARCRGRRSVGRARRATAGSWPCTKPTAAPPAKPSVGARRTPVRLVASRGMQVLHDVGTLPAARRGHRRSPSAPTTACTSGTGRSSPRCGAARRASAAWGPRWSPSTATRPWSCGPSRRRCC